MRKFQIATIAASAVLLLAGGHLALAQDIDTSKVAVAFPFMVGRVLMPAGTYSVIPDEMDPGVLEIRSDGGHMSAFATILATDITSRRGECQFQFVNVGGRYYLTRIDDGTGDLSNVALPEAVARAVHAATRNARVSK